MSKMEKIIFMFFKRRCHICNNIKKMIEVTYNVGGNTINYHLKKLIVVDLMKNQLFENLE